MNACETPLLDLLRAIPADARLIYEHSPMSSQCIPVGVLAAKCISEIERLTADYAAATHLLADRDAQIERLAEELDYKKIATEGYFAERNSARDAWRRVSKERDAANAVIDELRADAERLIAIESNGWVVERDIEGEWLIGAMRRYGAPVCMGEGMTLRAAIDAARALRREKQDV